MRNLKNLFCLAALMFFSVYSQGQSNYYYYQGEKIFLEESTDDVLIRLSSDANQTELSSFLNSSSYKKMKSEGKVSSYKILHLSTNNKSAFEKNKELERLRENRNILSANFMLKFEGGSLQGCSNEFVVKLSPSTSFSDFDSLCKKNKILSLEENRFVRGKYILTTSKKSNKGVLQLANEFYETGFFEYSEPVFFREKILHTNDPLYGNQWPLNTTVGINVENAWHITRGTPEIRIAVVDEGVDLNHPDLVGNLLQGFDATGNGSGGAPTGNEAHGTACAGIIGATSDNNIGITGVAPNCAIMPARSQFGFGGTDSWLSDCIEWAWQNNADVISNSWGGGSPSNQITDAINNATNLGRDGLGCIVLFSSGNDGASVSFPAVLPNVIAVGATSNTGGSESYSNFGNELDIVAPGGDKNLTTTDISGSNGYDGGDYTSSFDGTSAACPHAAGVAGLVLSVNRCLTWQETKVILELSCDKVGGYCYNTSSSHPNGTWNNQMGHGRVNAFKAVQYAHSVEVNSSQNVGGGVDQGAIGFYQWVLSSGGCSGLAAASYFVKRHEVHKNVSFPYTEAPLILGTSNGVSSANPNNGNYWLGYQNLTETSATLKTNVYEITNVLGQQIGWVPTSPSNVKFDYTVLSAIQTDLFLQNQILSGNSQKHNVTNLITAGNNVTSSIPQGDYIVQGTANIQLRAGNEITLNAGTTIQPNQGGIFSAVVEPFFTCTQFPMGKMVQTNGKSGEREVSSYDQPFFKSYNVIFSEDSEDDLVSLDNIELKIYPNPCSDHSTIEYILPKNGQVTLSVFDSKGVELVKLENRKLHQAGNYKIDFNINDYPAGIYIVNILTGRKLISKQLIKN